MPTADPVKGTASGSPLDDLPPGVRALTDFGQRPDWSPDAQQIVFLDGSPLGNVWVADVESGKTRELTKRFGSRGYSRAYFSSTCDLLLCGPTSGSSMRIAWNRPDIDYTDPNLVNRVVNGITEIWTGDIRDVDGRATIVGARNVVNRDNVGLRVQPGSSPRGDQVAFQLSVNGETEGQGAGILLMTLTGQ